MEAARALVRHLAVLMSSQLITSLLSLLTILLAPIYLGDVQLGRFALAQSATLVIGSVSVMGTNIYLVKEIAGDRAKLPMLVGTSVVMRLAICSVASSAVIGIVFARGSGGQTVLLLLALSMVNLVTITNMAFAAALQGLEAMKRKSVAAVVDAVIVAMVGVPLLITTHSPVAFSLAMLAGVSTDLAINLLYFRRRRIRLQMPRWKECRLVLVGAAPFVAMALSQGLYNQLDVIVLGLMSSEATVGWFASAARWAPTVILIPVVAISALMPVLTRLEKSDPAAAARLFRKVFDLMLLIVVPMSVGLVAISPKVYGFLYPSVFHSSIPILSVLSVSWAITAAVMVLGVGVISSGHQRSWGLVSMSLVVVFLVLNIILIPLAQRFAGNAGIGAASASVVGESVMALAAIRMLPAGRLTSSNLVYLLRVIAASLVMALVVALLGRVPLFAELALGALVYVIASAALRTITRNDLIILRSLLQRSDVLVGVDGPSGPHPPITPSGVPPSVNLDGEPAVAVTGAR